MSIALQEGTVFAGRYEVVRCIATGGMGAVYEVTHIETQRRRALKVMLPHLLRSPELRERFKREARIAAQVDSEFIVDVFDAGIDEATEMPFLVMELLRGEELGRRLARLGRLPAHEVVACLHQTALALDKTHRAAIVHRDLKPENLFLVHREQGISQIKVLDFGVAKFMAENATQANATLSVGTPYYMAPEQFRAGPVSPAADLYALGMIAYTLLVGEPYWVSEGRQITSVISFAMIAVDGPKEPATARAARVGVELPPPFDAWFFRATASDPAARFQTATAAIEGLAEALGIGAAGRNLLLSREVQSSPPHAAAPRSPSEPRGTRGVTPAEPSAEKRHPSGQEELALGATVLGPSVKRRVLGGAALVLALGAAGGALSYAMRALDAPAPVSPATPSTAGERGVASPPGSGAASAGEPAPQLDATVRVEPAATGGVPSAEPAAVPSTAPSANASARPARRPGSGAPRRPPEPPPEPEYTRD
ncbi:protein kinase domain-containing protein [Sorangium sp. So ce1389]|uniref:serine/threonine-protein kinase n=1 Tax=Sorangium sp. So ce1389 TaxID=3133336 RepID=UPI003F640C99